MDFILEVIGSSNFASLRKNAIGSLIIDKRNFLDTTSFYP
jgi:hypothetical protein